MRVRGKVNEVQQVHNMLRLRIETSKGSGMELRISDQPAPGWLGVE